MRGREVTILTDPYEGADWGYPPVATTANVVTVSNDHPHHAGMSGITGKPRVLRGPGEYEIGGALIWGIRTLAHKNGGLRSGSLYVGHSAGEAGKVNSQSDSVGAGWPIRM